MLQQAQKEKISFYDLAGFADSADELCQSAELIVDAVYGIGFHGEADENTAKVLRMANNSTAYKVAIDIPSGTE